MKILVITFLVLSTSMSGLTQDKIKTLTLSDSILYVAIDRPGDLYAITKHGQIQRFDPNGKLTLLYKGEKAPTLFDPRDGARLFAYYRDDQHYEFLNPSFKATASYKIDPSFAIQPWLLCPSGDYKLWILDKADNSLKKINIRASEVELEVMVDSSLIKDATVFRTMREYQSFVFLLDPAQGILIFNNLGQHIRTISQPGLRSFNFLGEELYYLRGSNLEFFNLFTAEKRQLAIKAGYTESLLTDERMILISPDHIDIFAFRP
jgi:hypothetical protein